MTIRFVHLCPTCGKSFASAAGLGGHLRWIHGVPGQPHRAQACFVTRDEMLRGFASFLAENEAGLPGSLTKHEGAWLYEAYKVGLAIGARFAAMDEKIEDLALEIAKLSETSDQHRAVKAELRQDRVKTKV